MAAAGLAYALFLRAPDVPSLALANAAPGWVLLCAVPLHKPMEAS
jgi:hypothetical protein